MANVIYAELIARDVSAQLLINDIPLRRVSGPSPPFVGIPVVEYLLAGDNELEVVIATGPTPQTFREGPVDAPPDTAVAQVRVALYEEGEFIGPDSGRELARLTWRAADSVDESFPLALRQRFRLDTNPPAWRWVDGQSMRNVQQSELNAYVGDVHAAFAARRAGPIIDRARIYFEEQGVAYPDMSAADRAEEFRHDLEVYYSDKSWQVQPFDPSQTSYRFVGNERMVECIGRDWEPLVRTIGEDTDDYFPFPMFVALIDGRLEVVR